MRIIIIFIFLTLFKTLFGQNITLQQANSRLSSIFKQAQKRPEVLLLGTYHFSYPDADEYKTTDSLQADVLSSKKKNEIKQVISALLKFSPTKIVIEAKPIEQANMIRFINFT